MPQHALQPVFSGCGGVDGECGPAVHHRHGRSGQEVIRHLDDDLPTQVQRNVSRSYTSDSFDCLCPTVRLLVHVGRVDLHVINMMM